jgi:uncharacterized protein YjbI with pentapeptide repeats
MMADEEQIKILRQGAESWNMWREEHHDTSIDLREANLEEVNLVAANLRGVNLRGANLKGARGVVQDLLKLM